MKKNELEKLLDEYKEISEFIDFINSQIKSNKTEEEI